MPLAILAATMHAMHSGRSTNYQPKMAAKVCAELSSGRSLREICDDPGFPSRETVRQWHAKHEDFRREYDDARLLAVDLLADDINELADSADAVVRAAAAAGVNENAAISGLRVQIDTKKWLLSKLSPRYGDRVQLAGDPEQPLLPPETDINKLSLMILSVLNSPKDAAQHRAVVKHEPASAIARAPAAPTRVFDASSGQLVRTLPPDEPRQPSTVLAPPALPAEAWRGSPSQQTEAPMSAALAREEARLALRRSGREEVEPLPQRCVVRPFRGGR